MTKQDEKTEPKPAVCPGCGRCNTCGRSGDRHFPYAYPVIPSGCNPPPKTTTPFKWSENILTR